MRNSFNPRPPLLAGDAWMWEPSRRFLRGFNPRPPLLAGDALALQVIDSQDENMRFVRMFPKVGGWTNRLPFAKEKSQSKQSVTPSANLYGQFHHLGYAQAL